ncbi:MAG: SCO family protein [Phycisphaerales bacterium]
MPRLAPLIPALLAVSLAALVSTTACAQVLNAEPPEAIRDLEIRNTVGEQVPLDIPLYDSEGQALQIGDYFTDRRPVLLLMVYYDCPLLCGLMLNKMNEVVNEASPTVGEDYKIVVVSFDHANTSAMAKGKQTLYHAGYDRGLTKLGRESYRFHTTTAAGARRLADAIGFDYRFMPASGEFSHPSVMYLLTPDGRVSSYLSGLDYEAKQLQIAILDASDGKTAMSIGEFFLHMCFSFDPTAGAYTLEAFRVMQIAGVLSVLGVGGLVGGLRIWEVVRRRNARASLAQNRTTSPAPASRSAGLTPTSS